MNVSLTQEMGHFISERVASGRYRSASEVVREALRLLQEREEERQVRLGALRAEIVRGSLRWNAWSRSTVKGSSKKSATVA